MADRRRVRLSAEMAAWLDAYAEARGVSRRAVLDAAMRSFVEDCARGVPDLEEVPDAA